MRDDHRPSLICQSTDTVNKRQVNSRLPIKGRENEYTVETEKTTPFQKHQTQRKKEDRRYIIHIQKRCIPGQYVYPYKAVKHTERKSAAQKLTLKVCGKMISENNKRAEQKQYLKIPVEIEPVY